MKNHLLMLLFALCGALGAEAQQPATTVLNGKTYYVYPYQQQLATDMRMFHLGVKQQEIIHRDSLNRSIVSTEVKPVKHYLKLPSTKAFRKYKKTFLAIRKDHPGYLMNFYLPLEQDITPMLEPLPDGEYVQFYRDVPYVDENSVLRYRNDIVAGFFSLKKNQLDGYAYWLNSLGDTIKAGNFRDGLKEGNWFANEYTFTPFDEKEPKAKISPRKFLDGTYTDTLYTHVSYRNGLLDGPYEKTNGDFVTETGFYKKGDACGEWFQYGYKVRQEGIKLVYTGERTLLYHYVLPEKPVTAKSVIVRNTIIDFYQLNRSEFNVSDNAYFEPFCRLYRLHEEKEEEGLELPEEKTHSYPGEAYGEGVIYGDYGPATIGNLDFSYSNYKRTFEVNGKEYTRNDLIDSVGYEFLYDRYEEYYPNGQLRMRFQTQNGRLVSEDTVFWDNGNPVNIITALPATNEYEERVFDYDGKPVYDRIYDAQGNYLRTKNGKLSNDLYLINGRIYEAREYDKFYGYSVSDTLDYRLAEKLTIYESLWRFDSTLAFGSVFDPETRTLDNRSYALNRDLIYHMEAQFGENYDNMLATETFKTGKLTALTQLNGSYEKPLYEIDLSSDTVPSSRVKSWTRNFDLTQDFTLLYENKPFSGKFSLSAQEPAFRLKASPSAISIRYANGEKHAKAIQKAYATYAEKGKVKDLAEYITVNALYSEEVSEYMIRNLVPSINYVFSPVDDDFFYESINESEYGDSKRLSPQQAHAFDKTVEGQFLDGKPSGTWITKDQFGNITAKVPFVHGETDGTAYYYKTVEPAKKPKKGDVYAAAYDLPVNPLLKDSLPAERTHYLAKICHYRNGILNGPFREMNWMGDTVTQWNYTDGHLDGPTLERTKLAYSTASYERGAMNGIMQTWLTLPGRDTTLLYDLNFRNGALQGESKAYHLNGHIAKHGFFLSGQPIDDFEAYDTLGFRYQYVKFQFNQPVEEKIWEENQLSVRYEFDWRDSIYFNTSDIAASTSLEQMIYQLGLAGDAYMEPYYGRPSLVDKTGIDYTMTKYYPNDTIARQGQITKGKKTGCWMFYSYEGQKLYEAEYYDTILQINDSVRFKSKGILTLVDANQQPICKSWIVEKIEKYDCSHTDHHEIRMLYTFWERDPSEHRINGYVKNYYDNGVMMNEGLMKDGLATGIWKFYDPYGSLNQVGEYVLGKRQGRWLSGDLSKVKYMGDICLNPNLPNLDEIMSYEEKLLDISVIYYQMTAVKKREYYGVNMNAEGPPENYYGDGEGMYDEEIYYEDGDYYGE